MILAALVIAQLVITGLRFALAPRSGAPKPDAPKPARTEEGAAIPVVFGQATVAPNTCAFRSEAWRDGSVLIYYVDALLLLCHGPVDEITDMRFDDGQLRLTVASNRAQFPMVPASIEYSRFVDFATDKVFGGDNQGGNLRGSVYFHFGKSGQPVDTKYVEKFAATASLATLPTHDQLCYVFLDHTEWGESAQMRPVRFVVKRYPWALYDDITEEQRNPVGSTTRGVKLAHIGSDANPAAAIYEILTNDRWGLGLPTSAIDTESFLTASDVLVGESFGLSFVMEQQQDADAAIEDICRHVYGTVQQDPVTGLIRFDVHRDADTAVATVTTENATFHTVKRPATHELLNIVRVRFDEAMSASRSNTMPATVQVMDLASMQETGEQRVETYDYLMASTSYVASVIADRVLPRVALPLAHVRFTTTRQAAGWKVGDVLAATWTEGGLSSARLRLTRIDWGTLEEGAIECEAIEEPLSATPVVVPVVCPETIYNTSDSPFQWKEAHWQETVVKTYLSNPSAGGIVGGVTDLGADGVKLGGYVLFATGTVTVTATRTLTGLTPNAYYTFTATLNNWSSTGSGTKTCSVSTGDDSLPNWKRKTYDQAPENEGTTITVLGWSNAAGELQIAVTFSLSGHLVNGSLTFHPVELLDFTGGCDPLMLPPYWSAPSFDAVTASDGSTAGTFALAITVTDPDEAIALGTAVLTVETSDGTTYTELVSFTAGESTGDGTITDGGSGSYAAVVPYDTSQSSVPWRAYLKWYDPAGDGTLITADLESGTYIPPAAGGGSGSTLTLASVIDNAGNFVTDNSGNLVYAWITP